MNTPAPTLEQLQAELALLQAELDSTRKLGNDRASRGYHLQSVQTNVILGRASTSELEAARLAQDESVAALLRIPLLEQAVGDARQRIDDAQHRARVQHIDGIKESFQTTYDEYRQQSTKTLELFRELQRLDVQFRGIGSGPTAHLQHLLDPYQRELNLPALTGSLATRSGFSTGQE